MATLLKGHLLRSCFSYSIPKDFVIGKDILITFWMAHGYNGVMDEGQSIEDNALMPVSGFFSFAAKMFFPRRG